MTSTGYLTKSDCDLYAEGKHYSIYEKLGSHPAVINGKNGIYFAVWVPNVKNVSLVGNFNNWNYDSNPMTRIDDSDIYELFTDDIQIGDLYKYAIRTNDDRLIFKADPYGFQCECRPGTASVVADMSRITWSDDEWQEDKKQVKALDQPMSIYELHPGSWRLHRDEQGGWHFNYKELADELAFYAQNMGYTHVELMGIPEYPSDKTWGYKVTGYYAPTSRYGTPEEFAFLVNHLHKNGIGVILDWTPAYFANDSHGLAEFNGSPLYEYADPQKRELARYGGDVRVFDYTKNEVRSFLIANALYWIEKYHIDGLKINSVSTMIFRNYERKEGQYSLNEDGTTENTEALSFLRDLNRILTEKYPYIITIADESCAYKQVTHPVEEGGLGFTFKWKSIWMDQYLKYMSGDNAKRKAGHEIMTKGVTFNGTEDFVLPISHEDIAHEKSPLYQKMPGNQKEKVANMKLTYAYLFGQPGKKMIFMGQDFGQHNAWNDEQQLDWFQQADPDHKKLRHFVRDLQLIYKEYTCLHTDSHAIDSFHWVKKDDVEHGVISFLRTASESPDNASCFAPEKSDANLLFVINFSDHEYPDFKVGVPESGQYSLILDESGLIPERRPVSFATEAAESDGYANSLNFKLPAYGVAVFKY